MIVTPSRLRVDAWPGAVGNPHERTRGGIWQVKQTTDEIRRLQGCINDLMSVLAIPAMWRGPESAQLSLFVLDVRSVCCAWISPMRG